MGAGVPLARVTRVYHGDPSPDPVFSTVASKALGNRSADKTKLVQ